jgi:hypothetical protein
MAIRGGRLVACSEPSIRDDSRPSSMSANKRGAREHTGRPFGVSGQR